MRSSSRLGDDPFSIQESSPALQAPPDAAQHVQEFSRGLLVIERFVDFSAHTGAWRCINCGAAPFGRLSVLPDLRTPLHQRRRARTIPVPAESGDPNGLLRFIWGTI